MRNRLFFRYWIIVSALVTVLLVLGGATEMVFAYRENVERIRAIQQAEVRLAAGRIGYALAVLGRTVRDSASLPYQEGLLPLAEAKQEFHRLLKIASPVYEVRGYCRGGKLAVRASRIEADVVEACPAPPSQEASRIAGYAPIRYRNGSEPFTTLVIPLQDAGGSLGAVEADINLKFVNDVIQAASPGAGRSVYVLDGNDNLIAHTDPERPLKRLSFTAVPHVAALRAAGREILTLENSADLEGGTVVASGMTIGSSGWATFVEEPRDHALESAASTARRTGFMIVAGLVAAVLASLLLARRLSGPIVEVRRVAERIAEGDFDARIDVKTGDEVEALADEFNRMAAQLRDYTAGLERKVAEKTSQLQDALQVANDAMRARAVFLAAASHDLRQPLHAISLFAGALRTETLPESAAETVRNMRRAIDALRLLFDNLLDLSRFDAREVRVAERAVSILDVLDPVAAASEAECRAKGLRWKYQVADVWVRTDPELLRRLARNLLSNASRYTPQGEVQLVAVTDATHAVVQVIDTGIGIAPEDQARIFEEFVQLGNPARERDRGVGLGLSIVKRIGELIHADVRIDSRLGAGTTVSFRLPLVPAETSSVERDPAPVEEAVAFEGLRVWAVDDDADVRMAVASMLQGWGVEATVVSTRRELIALRESNGSPDAVILDDMVGAGDSGLEIAQWLRTFLPEERIVLITGNVDETRTEELEGSGLVVLRKPLAPADLAQWLREATAERAPPA